ncbi:MAG: hypothetical protein WC589_00755 [Sphingobacterium sp.]
MEISELWQDPHPVDFWYAPLRGNRKNGFVDNIGERLVNKI